MRKKTKIFGAYHNFHTLNIARPQARKEKLSKNLCIFQGHKLLKMWVGSVVTMLAP